MPHKNKQEGLKRVVGVTGLSLNIINGTVGAGIFALPAIIGIELGAFSIFAYIFCGIMMAAIMLCYAEIGTRITSSGGSYAYVENVFGDYAGFIVSWLAVFGWSILGSAALMNVIADSLAIIFPIFLNPWIRGLLYFILIGFLVLTNIRGAKQGVAFIKGITIIKLLPLFGIIIFGLSLINADNLHWEHLPSLNTFSNTTLILFFAFAGFETALGVSGEIKNPQRTIPLGILFWRGFGPCLIHAVTDGNSRRIGSRNRISERCTLSSSGRQHCGTNRGHNLNIRCRNFLFWCGKYRHLEYTSCCICRFD